MYDIEASFVTDITHSVNFPSYSANSDAFGPDLWLAHGWNL